MIGEVIKKRRQELGLTQREVAKDAEISLATLSRMERDQGQAAFENVVVVCKLLDIDLSSVLADWKGPIYLTQAEKAARFDKLCDLRRICPWGWYNDKVVVPSSMTEDRIITWLVQFYQLCKTHSAEPEYWKETEK